MKILVAVDETESGHEALQQALRLIAHQEIALILLRVEEPLAVPPTSPIPGVFGGDPMLAMPQTEELVEIAEKRTMSALHWAEKICQQAGIPYSSRSELGDPKHVICDVAKQEACSLVIVGSHRHGLIDRVLLGSVSDYVVHHAHCAVLVVRQENELNNAQPV
jgi:nucleotide-binding universal stress UspA family protein